jgi:hypothetical protein
LFRVELLSGAYSRRTVTLASIGVTAAFAGLAGAFHANYSEQRRMPEVFKFTAGGAALGALLGTMLSRERWVDVKPPLYVAPLDSPGATDRRP